MKCMQTTAFVTYLANMKDELRELSDLSLDLQRRHMSVQHMLHGRAVLAFPFLDIDVTTI